MTHSQVVLRQPALDEGRPLPSRRRMASDPGMAAAALALQAAQEEGQRQGREQGFGAGYEEGLREGRAAARAEADVRAEAIEAQVASLREERLRELEAAVAAVQGAAGHWLALAEEEMVALCYETIARVLGRAALAPESVRSQALQLLGQWRGQGVPALHLHPDDAVWLHRMPADRAFTCVADPGVAYGGCFVRGEGGALDARLERILEEVKAALLQARGERAPRAGAA